MISSLKLSIVCRNGNRLDPADREREREVLSLSCDRHPKHCCCWAVRQMAIDRVVARVESEIDAHDLRRKYYGQLTMEWVGAAYQSLKECTSVEEKMRERETHVRRRSFLSEWEKEKKLNDRWAFRYREELIFWRMILFTYPRLNPIKLEVVLPCAGRGISLYYGQTLPLSFLSKTVEKSIVRVSWPCKSTGGFKGTFFAMVS